jgi:hypothetical protein
MTLYDRLKDEYKEKLNDNLNSLPITAKDVMNELKTKEYWIHLTYGTLVAIYQVLDKDIINIMPHELFNDEI